MDIDDDPNANVATATMEEDQMMDDGAIASIPTDDAMQTDDMAAAHVGGETDDDMDYSAAVPVEMDEVMVEGEEEEGNKEIIVEVAPSARMSPVDAAIVDAEPSFSAFPPIINTPVDSPTASGFQSGGAATPTPSTWPPAPTDIPAVPSRLPDAISVVASGLAAEHAEAGTPGDSAEVLVEHASVRAEAPGSVSEVKVVEEPEESRAQVSKEHSNADAEGTEQEVAADEPAEPSSTALTAQQQEGSLEDQDVPENEYDEFIIEASHQEHHEDGEDVDEESMEDVIPPILLVFSETHHRSLFYPLPADVEHPLPSSSTEPTEPLCADRAEELVHVPLEDFFTELRGELGEEWREDRGIDMVLDQRDVRLAIRQNDKQTLQLSLMDIITLHMRLGIPQPIVFHISSEPENFYRRYKTILGMLDAREASEHEETGEEVAEAEPHGEAEEQVEDEEQVEEEDTYVEEAEEEPVEPVEPVDETEEAGEQVYEKRQVEKDKATDAVVHDAAVEGEGQEAEREVAIDADENDLHEQGSVNPDVSAPANSSLSDSVRSAEPAVDDAKGDVQDGVQEQAQQEQDELAEAEEDERVEEYDAGHDVGVEALEEGEVQQINQDEDEEQYAEEGEQGDGDGADGEEFYEEEEEEEEAGEYDEQFEAEEQNGEHHDMDSASESKTDVEISALGAQEPHAVPETNGVLPKVVVVDENKAPAVQADDGGSPKKRPLEEDEQGEDASRNVKQKLEATELAQE